MAEVITSGKVIQKPELVLEVDDFLPPGVIGVRNKTREEDGNFEGAGDNSTGTGTLLEEDQDDVTPTKPGGEWLYDELPIPDTMTIVSQTVRIGADRKVVVDVVIETEDYPGITEFEARIIRDAPNS